MRPMCQHNGAVLQVPVQMWRQWAQSRCRCGRGGPNPGADVAVVGVVPAQMWQGRAQSRRRCGQRFSLCVDGCQEAVVRKHDLDVDVGDVDAHQLRRVVRVHLAGLLLLLLYLLLN